MSNTVNLEDTVDGMLSSDYKERFKAEYMQTKIRYEKLKTFITKIEAYASLDWDKQMFKDEPKHDCSIQTLREQLDAMGKYLHVLEIRAVVEDIDLTLFYEYLFN